MSASLHRDGKWKAKVRHGDGMFHVGMFDTVEEAREACRLEYERLHDGTSAILTWNAHMPTRDYAALIHVPAGTVKRWVSEGLPTVKVGNVVRIDPDVANVWVTANHANSVAFGRKSSIYVAQRDSDSAVKIGYTSDVERRMRELRKDTRSSVCLVASFPGDKPAELRLHDRFAVHRLDGEWFSPSPDVLAFISSIGVAA